MGTVVTVQTEAQQGPKTDIEPTVQAKARELFSLVARNNPSLLSAERWQSEMMDWAMQDEQLKVELFRFVDVFPTLGPRAEIARHLREYFASEGVARPRLLRWGISLSGAALAALAAGQRRDPPPAARLRAALHRGPGRARRHPGPAERCAARPPASRSTCSARPRSAKPRPHGYRRRYLELLDGLATRGGLLAGRAAIVDEPPGARCRASTCRSRSPRCTRRSTRSTSTAAWRPSRTGCGRSCARPCTRAPLSRSTSSSSATATSPSPCSRELLERTSSATTTRPAWCCRPTCATPRADLRGLLDWARGAAGVINLRLVKGAYWDYETVHRRPGGLAGAGLHPQARHRRPVRAAGARHARAPRAIRPAFASHNVRSLAAAIATAEALGVARRRLRDPDAARHGRPHQGGRARASVCACASTPRWASSSPAWPTWCAACSRTPPTSPSCARPSSRATAVDRLVLPPQPRPSSARRGAALPASRAHRRARRRRRSATSRTPTSAARENRAAYDAALDGPAPVASAGRTRCGSAAGRSTTRRSTVGEPGAGRQRSSAWSRYGGPAEAEPPSPPPRGALPAWRDTPPAERAAVLFRAAELMRGELFELAALETLEAGKTPARGRRRRRRGHRLPRVLRPRDAAPGWPQRTMGARARRAQPLLLPAARRGPGRSRPGTSRWRSSPA